ncbi:sodium:solute symporter family transporter [Pelagicoccus mobilis]|uniref:Na+:solute symporter n=1 Tax=Pelagicoccus mobilis TaxID=415221 RepID=A0A934VSX3_9BACT|nr:hypothetical protein [Pelagicoccus mobilis]MBK1878944.1 hypothetical protein [Pelagicoccus mobilis]
MQTIDYLVVFLYVLGIVAAGMVFASRMKNSKEMFSAGGQSPWWVSGLSGFMTMFSAGTFVIWGGIAYRYGVVAIVINLGYGVAAILVGRFVAGYWKKLGVDSAPEFLQMRFGGSVVQFYTWYKGTIQLFQMGGSVYALSKIVCTLMPLPAGHFLADPSTGHLSVSLVSIALCVMVIIITFVGGLWAVLMTDVLQFVILTISVIFVVPLILGEAGGWGSFISQTPEGFLHPVAADFSWWFIIGWMLVNFFNLSGEWTFVQRYLCVPTAKDAKKSAYLVGVLYLVSPVIWMIPPLVYRVLNEGVDPEQAYILSCQLVLPAGMMGLMVAAMASATASMATTRLNVFAGAFTTEVYHRVINKDASERRLVAIGRLVTVILGCIVIAGTLLIPRYGYTSFIIDINTLLSGPMLLPTLWGLFSKKIDPKAIWITVSVGFVSAFLIKFGLSRDGFLTDVQALSWLVDWIAGNSRIVDLLAGIAAPLLILSFLEITGQKEHAGWGRVMEFKKNFREHERVKASTLPGKMVVISMLMISVVMGILALVSEDDAGILLSFSLVVLALAGVVYYFLRRADEKSSKSSERIAA